MDAVAVMAPGRFRRRLSDDHSDTAESPLATASASLSSSGTSTVTEASPSTRSWLGGLGGLDGTGSTRGRLPWLSPRERRHPLRDVRLSCFRSYLPGSIGGTSEADLLCGDSTPTSPRTPKTPRLPGGASSKDRGDKEEKSRGLSLSVRRSPGRSRGSKSSENVYFVSPPRTQPDQQQEQQPPPPSKQGQANGANLSARLRALSARCMALVHAAGGAGGDRKANISASSSGKKSSRPCKQRSFSSGALPGLHDFQRRQLNPIYRDDADDADDAQPDDETPLSPSPSNGILVGDEDGDSGILVSEATSTPLSSLPGSGGGAGGGGGRGGRGSLPWGSAMGALGAATAASRAQRSASLDRELLGGSPLLDHDEGEGEDPDELSHATTSQARRSRASTKSSSSSSEISEIFSRFQRRRVAGTSTPSSSSRPSSPPLLPAPPQRSTLSPEGGQGGGVAPGRRREFHLVRLTRATPTEELGIFIAKSDAPDRGAQGYVVAHVVPGGLAHRDGQLRLGDELVVVNGRQLRGLSMAAARHRLRAGPTQVDIVIARQCQCQSSEGRDSGLDTSGSGDSMTECCCKAAQAAPAPDHTPSPARRTLPESSVDYENVVLRPRDRTPVPASPGKPEAAAAAAAAAAAPPDQVAPAASSTAASASPSAANAAANASPVSSPSPSGDASPVHSATPCATPSPMASRQQLFQKHAAPASTKAARRSLAIVSRSSSPPLEPLEPLDRPAETQHHSLKRRARRHGARHGGHDGGVCSVAPATEFLVELRKGPGCGALGFTVVGGADSPRGALPIFVRSVLEGGQAAHDGRLQPGDELLLLNGQPLRGATHSEAVAMFRAVRAGPVVLTVCRRTSKKAQSCSDLVVGQGAASQRDDA